MSLEECNGQDQCEAQQPMGGSLSGRPGCVDASRKVSVEELDAKIDLLTREIKNIRQKPPINCQRVTYGLSLNEVLDALLDKLDMRINTRRKSEAVSTAVKAKEK